MQKETRMVLACMTETQRRRYTLYLRGWTLTRIAEEEGVSVNSVRMSILNGRKRAKTRMSHY